MGGSFDKRPKSHVVGQAWVVVNEGETIQGEKCSWNTWNTRFTILLASSRPVDVDATESAGVHVSMSRTGCGEDVFAHGCPMLDDSQIIS